MINSCFDDFDFIYPLSMEIYYPVVDQGAYGNVKKQWILDQTVKCFFNPAGRKYKTDVQADVNITIDNAIVGRVPFDITQSSRENLNSMTNIIITNIKDVNGNLIYNESAGIRKGKATIFEVATINPIIGAFADVDYYKIVIRRSDNQAVDI
jgi:hypothetical protein